MNTKKVKYLKKAWSVKCLVPADFLECAYYPFAYYKLPEDDKPKLAHEIKRDWKLPPKRIRDEQIREEEAVKTILKKGLGLVSNKTYNEIKKDKDLSNYLFAEIYCNTYQLSNTEKYLNPQKIINKEFAERIAVQCMTLHLEPYSFMADLSKEKPALYNPKRYDFNIFILGVGWDRMRREQEEMEAKIKKDIEAAKRRGRR